ncbi:arginine biosynthesis bifunctional protein ARG7 [Flagelloscypha sp. PMI_526]|nr:arginine biosynthesis bifunctional protein ARG7 [Flagelloscypha sp. PMI_526]
MSHLFKRYASSLSSNSTKAHWHRRVPDSAFPKGYLDPHALDLALIISTTDKHPSAAAAPVTQCQDALKENHGRARAIVVNSGCANAVTGREETSSKSSETLVMSTGVIGQQLPISKIVQGIQSQSSTSIDRTLGSSFESWERAAQAFMTTDTFPKLRSRTFSISGNEYRLVGIDKGAGMIHPRMSTLPVSPLHATLLACVVTDAPVSPRALESALAYAVDRSFNSISVDGDMSTNDTILALANGAAAPAGTPEIDWDSDLAGYLAFRDELTSFTIELAQLVVRDGEGATKFVSVTVKNAESHIDAHTIASKISTSALVKTALYGEDANWGRILAAAGSVDLQGKPIDPSKVSVTFVPADNTAPLPVLVNGEPENVDEERASEILKAEDFSIVVDLRMGSEIATYFTCDFSYEYVRINGDYRS